MDLTMGLPLPDELTDLTFNHLDVPSLLRCMQVCKSFHSIISGSTLFTYKIELFASCMEDNEQSSMDTVNRLNLLREYNEVWNSMKWTSFGSIPMCNGHCWEFSGGMLAQSTHQNEISLVQLPCKLKGIEERRWSVPFDFRVRDFTLDNSQDLIVLLELTDAFPNMCCKLHLRTLSGKHHPHSSVPQIIHTLENLHVELSFLIQICGNRLAVLFYDPFNVSTQNHFFVWNWRTGKQEVCIHMQQFQSFAFMTEDLILATVFNTNIHDTLPALRVLSIAAYANPVHSLSDMPYVCELQYPVLQGTLEYLLVRSEPTPSWKPPISSRVPFYTSRKDFIFTITMRVLSGDAHENTVLFVPLSTLLSEVDRSHSVPHRSVPWEDWGPNGTRMISREPSETWVCYTYGMKFVQGLRWKNGHTARVYDFNPYAAKKHVVKSNDTPIWRRLAKQSKISARCESFEEEVVTTLPGRVANITLPHSDEGWDSVMIGEDNILMVQPNSSTYGYMAM